MSTADSWEFFKSDDSLVIVTFLHSALLVFKKPLLLLQSTSASFPELAGIFELFKRAILKRHSSEFYGAKTAELLKGIDKDCAEVLKSSFKEFYEVTLEYIDKRYRPEKHPANVAWILLRNRKAKYDEVKEMAKQIDPQVAMADELFDEVSALNGILQNIPDETFSEDGPETKRMKLLSENDSLPLIYKLGGIVFSIPVSNAFVERVFSPVSSQWRRERNRLNEATAKSLLQVRVNLDFSCSKMHGLISKDQKLLKQIVGGEKYLWFGFYFTSIK